MLDKIEIVLYIHPILLDKISFLSTLQTLCILPAPTVMENHSSAEEKSFSDGTAFFGWSSLEKSSSEASLDSLSAAPTDQTFIEQFISSRGNEYFCEIDEEYLTDRFNLTGLNTEVPYYQYALDLITDVFDLDADDDLREQIEKSARHLYGLVHARYIVTTRGLAKMVNKTGPSRRFMILMHV